MSRSEAEQSQSSQGMSLSTGNKRSADQAELEVDLNAPEPPSKKAIRKAKRNKAENQDSKILLPENSSAAHIDGAEDVVSNRGKRSEHGIWIGNLSFTTTKQDLLDFMTGDVDHVILKSEVTRIHLPAAPAKHGKFQNKGFAYIDVADGKALQSALELSEKLLGGRRVLVKDAKSFEGRPKDGKKEDGTAANPPSKRIFVGNLAFDTTAEDLETHFGVCGSILHSHMATFEDSGKCKGYAWIEFEQLPSAQNAMRGWVEEGRNQHSTSDQKPVKRSERRIWLHKMQGRKLRLEYAEDKATRYQKRYGKEAKKAEIGAGTSGEETQVEDRDQISRPESQDEHGLVLEERREGNRGRQRKVRQNGYAEDTVNRLKGAIVESQGNKVKFD